MQIDPLRPEGFHYATHDHIKDKNGDDINIYERKRGISKDASWNVVKIGGVAQKTPLLKEDVMAPTLLTKFAMSVSSEEQACRIEQSEPEELQGIPVNADDYPDGRFVIFPGDGETTLKLVNFMHNEDTSASIMTRRMYIENISKCLQAIAAAGKLDLILIDLDPSMGPLNKWMAGVSDMVMAPVQPETSSAFALMSDLTDVFPAWINDAATGMRAIGAKTHYNLAHVCNRQFINMSCTTGPACRL